MKGIEDWVTEENQEIYVGWAMPTLQLLEGFNFAEFFQRRRWLFGLNPVFLVV